MYLKYIYFSIKNIYGYYLGFWRVTTYLANAKSPVKTIYLTNLQIPPSSSPFHS